MCRNIKPLFNFDPPATDSEIHDAALQFVRKVSGFTKPSEVNEEAFTEAVNEVTVATAKLLGSLKTIAPHKDRLVEKEKARLRNEKRFGV